MNPTFIEVVAGDSGYELDFTTVNSDGSIFDISGSTLTFRIQQEGTTTVGGGSMSIISGPSGTCKYIVAAGDFPNAATYYAQIIVVNGGSTITFPNITVQAVPKIVIK